MKSINHVIKTIVILVISVCYGQSQDLIIRDVNIVDVEKAKVNYNMNVLIENGSIYSITEANKMLIRKDVSEINGTGKFLIPGFIDTHAHFAMGPIGVKVEQRKPVIVVNLIDTLPQITGKLLLDFGVTTCRDPGGKTDITVGSKSDIANGVYEGPELFVAGSILDTMAFENLAVKVTTKGEVEEEVRSQKRAGVDYVKLYTSLTPELLKAGIDEAHRQGLGTISHLHTTSWTEASNLGVDNIVHIIPGHDMYLPIETREDYQTAVMMGSKAFFRWFQYVDLDGPAIKELIKTLRSNGTSIDPTLVVFHAAFFGNTLDYKTNPLLDKLPEAIVNNWRTFFNFNIGWTEEDFNNAQKSWPKVQRFVKMLHDNGILITTGTDANNPWIVPGDSFHRELKLLTECGLSNAEVLKMATLNGAKLLNIINRVGSVEIGKEADLILLNANPLENIDNTRAIETVVSNGKIIE